MSNWTPGPADDKRGWIVGEADELETRPEKPVRHFDFASLKAQCRQAIHEMFSVDAWYHDKDLPEKVAIRVRWHSRINRFGNLDDAGWAEMIEGVDRIIFERDEVAPLSIRSGGLVYIHSMDEAAFTLKAQEPSDGPFEETWSVARV